MRARRSTSERPSHVDPTVQHAAFGSCDSPVISRLTTTSLPSPPRITKKSEKYFFDRDRVRWVEWEKEGEAFAEVAGEEAANPAKTKQNFPTTKSRIFSVVD